MENGFELIKKGQRNVQGFHVQTDKEKQMETYLRNNFPEYNELEFYMNGIFEEAARNNFGYGNDEQKIHEKYHQLRSFFRQYIYGLVKCEYINEENKQEIIRRLKRIRSIRAYNENNMVFGDNRDFGDEGVRIRLKDGLNEKLAAKIFYHEFNHFVIGGNLHIQYLQEQIERIRKLTNNNYWIKTLIKDGFLDELFAQDVAESIQAEIDGIQRTENDFAVYGRIQQPGIDFSKTIRGCKSIKDLVIKSFDKDFIDEIVRSYDNIEELQKVLTTLQTKLKGVQTNFYSQTNNETQLQTSTVFRNAKIEGIRIDGMPRKGDILDDKELANVLEKNNKKAISFRRTLRVDNNQSGFRTISRSDASIENTNNGFKTVKRTDYDIDGNR